MTTSSIAAASAVRISSGLRYNPCAIWCILAFSLGRLWPYLHLSQPGPPNPSFGQGFALTFTVTAKSPLPTDRRQCKMPLNAGLRDIGRTRGLPRQPVAARTVAAAQLSLGCTHGGGRRESRA